MPNPTSYDVFYSRPITQISIAYMQSADTVFDKVFPPVPVDQIAGYYPKYTSNDWWRVEAKKRVPGSESAGAGFNVSWSESYLCDIDALHVDLDDFTKAMATAPIDLVRDGTEFLTRQMLLKAEHDWIAKYFLTTPWTSSAKQGYAHGATTHDFVQWDDYTYSTPIKDVKGWALTMQKATGYKPNTLVVSPYVYAALSEHPAFIEKIQYTEAGFTTPQLMARAFEVDNIYVPGMIENTAHEGATASVDFMAATKACLLCYSAPRPSLLQPSAGYTFRWTGLPGGAAQGVAMRSFRNENTMSNRLEAHMSYDMKVVASDLGQWIYDVVT